MKQEVIKDEIERLRLAAEEKAGSSIMTLMEKRIFLARVVRAVIALLPDDSDLLQSITWNKDGKAIRICDKLAAIKLDNDLAGHGRKAGKNKAIADTAETFEAWLEGIGERYEAWEKQANPLPK